MPETDFEAILLEGAELAAPPVETPQLVTTLRERPPAVEPPQWQAPLVGDLTPCHDGAAPTALRDALVLPAPAPPAAVEQPSEGKPAGDRLLITQPVVVELAPDPMVAAPVEPPSPAAQAGPELPPEALPEPLPEPTDGPGEEALLRFRKLTPDRLSLRVEDADGTLDVEISREQAALQVKVVAPVDAIPDLLGLGSALEGALTAMGFQLSDYSAAPRQEPPPDADSPDEDGPGEEHEPAEAAPETVADRLLHMIV